METAETLVLPPLESLGPDLAALVRAHATPLRGCERISRQRAVRPGRETFRLSFGDGTTLKGRRLASAAAARRIEAIVDALDPDRFPRVLARRGAALLEEWVEGVTLDTRAVTVRHLRWAGATLAAVHRTPPPRGERAPGDGALRVRRQRVRADLARLVRMGALAPDVAGRLQDIAGARAPVASEEAVTHRDLCPENIVIRPDGRPFVVDNAAARLGPADEDLARTFYRWPMRREEEAAFLGAYRALRDPAGFLAHRAFWMVAAVAHAACVRAARGYAAAEVPVRRLVEIADGRACCTSPTTRS